METVRADAVVSGNLGAEEDLCDLKNKLEQDAENTQIHCKSFFSYNLKLLWVRRQVNDLLRLTLTLEWKQL